nr:uncharacterized protein LOC113826051 isoform X2 [Penaeus vannamei]
MWDVIGVSRSGRVRKKPATLKDFESPYDVGLKRMAGSCPNFPGKRMNLTPRTNSISDSDGSTEYDICNVIYEPLRVGHWKENSGDEDTIDVQDLPDADKIDPLLLENANADTPMENSEGTLDREIEAAPLDAILDDLIEVKEEPLETDFPRDYKTVEEDIANEDVDDALEDDPLRLDNDAEFTPVDTSDYSQIESMNLSANAGMNAAMTKDGPRILNRKLMDKGTLWTAYRLWSKEVRSDILKTNPNMEFADVNRKLGMLWSLVSTTKKYNWKRRARRLNEKERSIIPTSLRHPPNTATISAVERNSDFMELEDTAKSDFAGQGFNNIIITSEKEKTVLRTNAGTKEEALLWKDVYCQRYDYHFTCKKSYTAARIIFHGVFQCVYGDRQHQESKKTYTKCPVIMDVKIKVPTKDIIRNDPHIRTHPCFITIKGAHNHHTMLNELRVIKAVKEEFFKYFDLGMTAAQVSRFHEDKTNLRLADMGCSAVNPTNRAISFVYNLWLKESCDRIADLSMDSVIRKYAKENPSSTIELEFSENGFTAVLITDFMRRVHKEFKEAGDVVFVDTTCHVNEMNTAVTSLLCAGPAGAAPLGVIFTSSQEEGSYRAGFYMLKKALGKAAFYGQEHPHCFRTSTIKSKQKALRAIWPESEVFISNYCVLQQVWQCLCNEYYEVKKEHHPLLMDTAQQLVYADSPDKFEYLWESISQRTEFQQYDKYTRYFKNLVEMKQEWSIAYGKQKLLNDQHMNNIAESTMCIIKDIIHNRCISYTTSQLIIFMNEIYDGYMRQCLFDVALSQRRTNPIISRSVGVGNCTEADRCKFTVQSIRNKVVQYNVDLTSGTCNCSKGQNGEACKHLINCCEAYLQRLPQDFRSTPENRQWLASVAVGRKQLSSLKDFADLQKVAPGGSVIAAWCEGFEGFPQATATPTPSQISPMTKNNFRRALEGIKDLQDVLFQVINQYGDDDTLEAVDAMKGRLESIRSTTQLNKFLSESST